MSNLQQLCSIIKDVASMFLCCYAVSQHLTLWIPDRFQHKLSIIAHTLCKYCIEDSYGFTCYCDHRLHLFQRIVLSREIITMYFCNESTHYLFSYTFYLQKFIYIWDFFQLCFYLFCQFLQALCINIIVP